MIDPVLSLYLLVFALGLAAGYFVSIVATRDKSYCDVESVSRYEEGNLIRCVSRRWKEVRDE